MLADGHDTAARLLTPGPAAPIWEDQCDPPSVVAITTGPGKLLLRAPTAKQPDAAGRLNSGSSATNEQLRSLVADAMCQLSFEYRAVIYRAYYQGWTTARIADDLEITEAAVKSRLHDGLHTLRLIFRRIG